MNRLFRRAVSVTLAKPVEGQFFGQQPNAIVVTDLRVAFSVEKHLGQEPNTCELTIGNLSERTRAEVQRKPLHVRVEAGYDGAPQRLFVGDARWAESRREGPNWLTKIQVGDGERAYRHARVSRSFRAGVTGRDATREIARSMGLELPTNVAQAQELLSQYASGLTLQGPSQQEMRRILAPRGLSWSVQDGRLQILRDGEARADQALLVTQDTGMIGSPEYGPPAQKGEPRVLTVRTLLYPAITPGGKILVSSSEIKGLFRVERVTHKGDTHGGDWYSDVEAKPL